MFLEAVYSQRSGFENIAKMNTFTTLLCLGLTPAAPSVAAQDNSYLSPFRNVEGHFIPRDQADRIDRVVRLKLTAGIYSTDLTQLQVRQDVPSSPPPITLTPICDQFNNYFYGETKVVPLRVRQAKDLSSNTSKLYLAVAVHVSYLHLSGSSQSDIPKHELRRHCYSTDRNDRLR